MHVNTFKKGSFIRGNCTLSFTNIFIKYLLQTFFVYKTVYNRTISFESERIVSSFMNFSMRVLKKNQESDN